MTPEEAREIWYGQYPTPMNEEDFHRALEAGQVLGYLKREWDPIQGKYINLLTPLGVIAAKKIEKDKQERSKQRRGFSK